MKTIDLKCGYCDTKYNSYGSCACMFAKEELLQKIEEIIEESEAWEWSSDGQYPIDWSVPINRLKEFLDGEKK